MKVHHHSRPFIGREGNDHLIDFIVVACPAPIPVPVTAAEEASKPFRNSRWPPRHIILIVFLPDIRIASFHHFTKFSETTSIRRTWILPWLLQYDVEVDKQIRECNWQLWQWNCLGYRNSIGFWQRGIRGITKEHWDWWQCVRPR